MKNLLIFSLILFFSCQKKEKVFEYHTNSGEAFGSTYAIQYEYDEDLSQEIKNHLEYFDQLISTYREDSKIIAFNKSEKGVEADSVLLDLVLKCKKYNKASEGYFDPTVAPLSSIYGFSGKQITEYPTQVKINEVLNYIGFEKVSIKNDSLLKANPKTELNFNAITGYINDYIAQKFKARGINNFLIEIGGEIYAQGLNKEGKEWTVGIDVPEEIAEKREIFTTHTLNKQGLATSGNYRKFHTLQDGNKVVHTINPKDGLSKASNLLSATVIAETTAEADAIATALMAMGLEKSINFSQQKNYKILLIYNENGNLESKRFQGF